MEHEILAEHKGQYCPQRIVKCDYCEFPLPAVNLLKHQVVIYCAFKMKLQLAVLKFLINIYIYIRKYVGTGPSCVTYVADMLDLWKELTMKADAMVFQTFLQNHLGNKN